MLKITGMMTKVGTVLNTNLGATRAHPGQSPVGAGSIKLVLLVVWAMENQPLTGRQIAEITGMSETQSHRCLQLLNDNGYLIGTRVGRVTKSYKVNMAKLSDHQLGPIMAPNDLDCQISID